MKEFRLLSSAPLAGQRKAGALSAAVPPSMITAMTRRPRVTVTVTTDADYDDDARTDDVRIAVSQDGTEWTLHDSLVVAVVTASMVVVVVVFGDSAGGEDEDMTTVGSFAPWYYVTD